MVIHQKVRAIDVDSAGIAAHDLRQHDLVGGTDDIRFVGDPERTLMSGIQRMFEPMQD
jgi:hypothetical protein